MYNLKGPPIISPVVRVSFEECSRYSHMNGMGFVQWVYIACCRSFATCHPPLHTSYASILHPPVHPHVIPLLMSIHCYYYHYYYYRYCVHKLFERCFAGARRPQTNINLFIRFGITGSTRARNHFILHLFARRFGITNTDSNQSFLIPLQHLIFNFLNFNFDTFK